MFSLSNSRPPGATLSLDGVRGHRGQVIGSRQHVHEAVSQACEREGHVIFSRQDLPAGACIRETRSALRSALARRLRARGVWRSF